MQHLIVFIPLCPLLASIILMLVGRKLGKPVAGYLGVASLFISFVLSSIVVGDLVTQSASNRHFDQVIFNFIPFASVNFELLLDPLSSVMILFVSGVSTLICWYSIGYMRGDADFEKFFLYLTLFVSSMLILVLGANLLITFIGWEGVGLCSYFLISFWFEKDAPPPAGKKAMIVNRIGDAGFLIGIFIAFFYFKSLNYAAIFSHISSAGKDATIALGLLLLAGAVGKSAQLPLSGWLPDAMEGPTPVSALIHAATMVTAGCYLMVRIAPILKAEPVDAHIVAIVGILTAAFGALSAIAQTDIKKVLAYSTVSQIGYMFLGAGTGAYVGAIFLMVTHAFYKACLFLSAGDVIHGLHEEQNIKKMGGLSKFMPVTSLAFLVSWFAIGGVFPFSGFWSKGEVLLYAYNQSFILWLAGVLTALLTAYYMAREYSLVFLNKPRFAEQSKKIDVKEAPKVMLIPTVILAFLAVIGGLLGLIIEKWLSPLVAASAPSFEHFGLGVEITLGVVDAVIALIGAYIGYSLFRSRVDVKALEPKFLFNAFYYDFLLDKVFARPSTALANLIDEYFEGKVLGGIIKVFTNAPVAGSVIVKKLGSPYVRRSGLLFSIGFILFGVYVSVRGGFI